MWQAFERFIGRLSPLELVIFLGLLGVVGWYFLGRREPRESPPPPKNDVPEKDVTDAGEHAASPMPPQPSPSRELPSRAPPLTASPPPAEASPPSEVDAALVGQAAHEANVPAPDPTPRSLPKLGYEEEDDDADPTRLRFGAESPTDSNALPIIADVEAIADEPTGPAALILVAAAGQSDVGKVRKRNEDAYLVSTEHALFVVADGMGGYQGGDVASRLAIETLAEDFSVRAFPGNHHETIPRGASELGRAIQHANAVIREKAGEDKVLASMGTTLVAARFMLEKQRLYVGHVGDSRCYRVRRGLLRQLTTDHTMAQLGVEGPAGSELSRALGPYPKVVVDLIIAKPLPDDLYLLCSDGLTKMVAPEVLERLMASSNEPEELVTRLVARANVAGGRDNVTVIVMKVMRTTGLQEV